MLHIGPGPLTVSGLCRHKHKLDGITHDTEAVIGLERERSVAHAISLLVLLPNQDWLTIKRYKFSV